MKTSFVKVILVAESLSCSALAKAAREYVDRYFHDIVDTEAWIKGPAELIASILDSGDLYVESEITVWHAFQEFFTSYNFDHLDISFENMTDMVEWQSRHQS